MKYKLTLLNVAAFLFLIGCCIYTLLNYSTLSNAEGWGIVYMIGLSVFGLTALVVDLIIQWAVRSKETKIILNIVVLLIYLALFLN